MPSLAYREWITTRADALGEIEQAHAAVGGTGRGRRYATQQINQAYAVMLASQFQGYCRDLHRWRAHCERLARSFDEVMRQYLFGLTGTLPW
jgi:hypothetical protein